MVEHLITQHGKRNIVFVRGPIQQEDFLLARRRVQTGFASPWTALSQKSWLSSGEFERDISYAAMREFLSDSPVFDALFASDDDSAIGALKALNEAGRRVPDDVALVGFDDMRSVIVCYPTADHGARTDRTSGTGRCSAAFPHPGK